jgi:hypothetical protein
MTMTRWNPDKKILGYVKVEKPPEPNHCGNCVHCVPDLCPSGNSGLDTCNHHNTIVNEWFVCPQYRNGSWVNEIFKKNRKRKARK